MRLSLLALLVVVTLTAPSAHAQSFGSSFDPFDQGRIRVSAFFGAASGFNNTYFILGAGVGYFVLPGLELGAQVDEWLGSPPNVTRVAPELKYVFDLADVVKPYIGGFYRHWFIKDDFDLNSAGGRAGLIIVSRGARAYFSAGAAYERVLGSCTTACSYWFPEVGAALAF